MAEQNDVLNVGAGVARVSTDYQLAQAGFKN
jgi:ribulose 1,5-bisphosphate synthetase/thiazole synthase